MNRIRTFLFAIAISALMGAVAFAQVDSPPAAEPGGTMMTPDQMVTPAQTSPAQTAQAQTSPAQTTQAQTTTTAPRNDGFGWGWIGLLGLAGLAGLRRSDARPIDRDAGYPAKRADGLRTDGTRTDGTTTPRGVAP